MDETKNSKERRKASLDRFRGWSLKMELLEKTKHHQTLPLAPAVDDRLDSFDRFDALARNDSCQINFCGRSERTTSSVS